MNGVLAEIDMTRGAEAAIAAFEKKDPRDQFKPQPSVIVAEMRREIERRRIKEGLSDEQVAALIADIPDIRGPQEMARESDAVIVILGGAYFGGKTWSLLTDAVEHIDNPDFRCPVFRRTNPSHRMPGGTWPESLKLYFQVGGSPREQPMEWRFPSGAQIEMHQLQYYSNAEQWKRGGQMSRIYFDQLEEFEERMFWALFFRLRSSTGISPKLMGTCNPVPEDDPIGGWLNRMVAWWWDPKTGYAIPERSGVKRWFYRVNEELKWYGSKEEAIADNPDLYRETIKSGEVRFNPPTSLTFISAGIDDNPIGEELNPEYRSKLNQGTRVEKERGKRGNWLIVEQGGALIKPEWFNGRTVEPEEVPPGVDMRGWDKAGSKQQGNKQTSQTASGKLRMVPGEGDLPTRWYIMDSTAEYLELHEREAHIRAVAEEDGTSVAHRIEQEGASGGKDSAQITVATLAGFDVAAIPSKGDDKRERIKAFVSQAAAGNVYLVNGPWKSKLMAAARVFDGGQKGSDRWDAIALAFNQLALGSVKPIDWSKVR